MSSMALRWYELSTQFGLVSIMDAPLLLFICGRVSFLLNNAVLLSGHEVIAASHTTHSMIETI